MVKFKLHPLFLIFVCAFVYYGYGLLLANYLVVVLIHELAHAYVACKLGYTLKNVTLLPYGAALDGSAVAFKAKDEVKIALAGPLINVIMGTICIALWWVFPSTYAFTSDFVFANFVTAIFNIIPAFPLDGGRVLLALISTKLSRKKAHKIVKIVGITCGVLFGAFFVVSIFIVKSINYALITASIFIFCGVFYKDTNSVYTRSMYADKQKRLKKGMNVRGIAVDGTVKLYTLNSLLHGGYYNAVYVLDSKYKLKKILYEHDLENAFLKHSADTEIGKIIVNA